MRRKREKIFTKDETYSFLDGLWVEFENFACSKGKESNWLKNVISCEDMQRLFYEFIDEEFDPAAEKAYAKIEKKKAKNGKRS